MKKFWWILAILTAWILVGCDPVEPEPEPQPAPQPEEKIVYSLKDISEMTLREKVGQLFNVRAEDLDLTSSYTITAGSTVVTEGFNRYPCGGITLFAANIKNPEQIKALTKYLHGLGNYPLICVDEEGGRVARIANNSNFNVVKYASMSAVGATGDPKKAYEAGDNIGSYLSLYGFDVDLAPVSDVNTNPENVVIGDRAFGLVAATGGRHGEPVPAGPPERIGRRLPEAFPRAWRHEGRHALRLCRVPQDLG